MTRTEVKAAVAGWLPDALAVAGAAAVAYGAGQIYAPAGWIVAGLALVGAAFLARIR